MFSKGNGTLKKGRHSKYVMNHCSILWALVKPEISTLSRYCWGILWWKPPARIPLCFPSWDGFRYFWPALWLSTNWCTAGWLGIRWFCTRQKVGWTRPSVGLYSSPCKGLPPVQTVRILTDHWCICGRKLWALILFKSVSLIYLFQIVFRWVRQMAIFFIIFRSIVFCRSRTFKEFLYKKFPSWTHPVGASWDRLNSGLQ